MTDCLNFNSKNSPNKFQKAKSSKNIISQKKDGYFTQKKKNCAPCMYHTYKGSGYFSIKISTIFYR